MNPLDIYRGARVLVTGDTGFKGSWLVLWLQQLRANVVGLGLPPTTTQAHYTLLGLSRQIQHLDLDIRDQTALGRAVADFQPQFLFHLAAQALVSKGYADPKATFEVNAGGTVNILECVRNCSSLRAVINVTSDKAYKNREWIWGYRENDELGGRDPYSASKSCAEIVFASYFESYFRERTDLGVASVRAGNVIGGGDWAADRIVPDCVRSLAAGKALVLRRPEATRPWQHVLEPLGGYLLLGSRLATDPTKFSGAWNFGPETGAIRTVGDLAAAFMRAYGAPENMVRVDRDTAFGHEAGLLHLNCDKAHHQLGWRPRWDFDETVRQTACWYREQSRGTPPVSLSVAQIEAYASPRSAAG